jgi:hypothetical protein
VGYLLLCSTPEYPHFAALYRATELEVPGTWGLEPQTSTVSILRFNP